MIDDVVTLDSDDEGGKPDSTPTAAASGILHITSSR